MEDFHPDFDSKFNAQYLKETEHLSLNMIQWQAYAVVVMKLSVA
jgi:hypothetical protein